MDILNEVNQIFRDVIDNNDISIDRETTASDVDEWDSLNHMLIIVAIEKHFKLKFSSAEIRSWQNVGHVCDSIALKVQK